MSETCLENLNRSLREMMDSDPNAVILGEDIGACSGGAFKAEKDLAELYPDRVISTPISEESIAGMAIGLAMDGYKPIVDFMFSDFSALAFDAALNIASKVKTMYGSDMDLPVIFRAANGGYRGYGPTHSQSMQKYFMGIPNVSVYEMSPFHDNAEALDRMMSDKRLCMYFEEKLLYNFEMRCDPGAYSDIFSIEQVGGDENWIRLATHPRRTDIAIVAPGGCAGICMDAAERLLMEDETETSIFIPSRLWPASLDTIEDRLSNADRILIAEESTMGADWGSALLGELYRSREGNPRWDIRLVSSEDAVIPADIEMEKEMLISADDIVSAARG